MSSFSPDFSYPLRVSAALTPTVLPSVPASPTAIRAEAQWEQCARGLVQASDTLKKNPPREAGPKSPLLLKDKENKIETRGTLAGKQQWSSNQGGLVLKSLLLPSRNPPWVQAHIARCRGGCTNPLPVCFSCVHGLNPPHYPSKLPCHQALPPFTSSADLPSLEDKALGPGPGPGLPPWALGESSTSILLTHLRPSPCRRAEHMP